MKPSQRFLAYLLIFFLIQPLYSAAKKAAILRSETHILFTALNQWTGGPQVYEDEVINLQNTLNKAGIAADIIGDDDVLKKLNQYRAVYIIDTLALRQETQYELEDFVKRGGLLVALGDFARNIDYSWLSTWYYKDLFGLKPVKADEWQSCVSTDPGLFLNARLKDNTLKLAQGLSESIEFGSGTEAIWTCEPAGADVAAVFPRFVSNVTRKRKVINKEAVAVSVNKYEKGYAIFIAALPGGRSAQVLKGRSDIQKILANTRHYYNKALSKKLPRNPEFYLTASQIGYLPAEAKFVILRAAGLKSKKQTGEFQIIDQDSGKIHFSGRMEKADCYKWPDIYLKGDFTAFNKPGKYIIKADIHFDNYKAGFKTFAFEIQKGIYYLTIPVQLDFLRKYAAGIDYYLNDPVTGGFIDASGDYSVWMWANPHVVYCLAELYENLPDGKEKERALFLMDHGAKWCLDMQKDDGDINSGVTPGFDIFILYKRPWEDKDTKRELKYWQSFNYLTTYIVALSKAYRVSKGKDRQRDQYLQAAQKAYKVFDRFTIEKTVDLGNAIWAVTELYKCTQDMALLKQAVVWAEQLISRQITDKDFTRQGIYGEFSDSDSRIIIPSAQQYKVFHNLGVYLGLLELLQIAEQAELKIKIKNALDLFFTSYLKKMSSLSPYGQIAHGLEKGEYGYEPVYFPPYTSWIGLHALNCDHGAMAFLALKAARQKGDRTLFDLAMCQLQWIMGQNPLNYCMITGLGTLNPPLLPDQGTGDIPGGIPNGIAGGFDDVPTWGNSTESREYWLPQSAYFLAAVSLAEKIQETFK